MSTSEAGSKIQYVNLVILLAILVLLVIGHLGGDKPRVSDPNQQQVEMTAAQKDPISKAAVAYLVGENGKTELVGKNGKKAKKCNNGVGSNEKYSSMDKVQSTLSKCKAFKDKAEIQDINTFSVIKTKGSHIFTQKVGNLWEQICYNDNWIEIDCDTL